MGCVVTISGDAANGVSGDEASCGRVNDEGAGDKGELGTTGTTGEAAGDGKDGNGAADSIVVRGNLFIFGGEQVSDISFEGNVLMRNMAFKLQPLPWNPEEVADLLSKDTIVVHHDYIQQGYVHRLNDLVEKNRDIQGMSLEKIAKEITGDAKNFAAQILNHDMYWKSISPTTQQPQSMTYTLILELYETLDKFKEMYLTLGLRQFGSGYIWFIYDQTNRVIRITNEDDAYNPIMDGYVPLICIDIWEHAYIYDYANDRKAYLERFWNHINWALVERNLIEGASKYNEPRRV